MICIAIMISSPINYLQGKGTKYSAGYGPTLCYALGFLLLILSDILIIIYRKKINSHTIWMLIPLSTLTLVFMGIQIVVPEFLFTGCALTITTVGVFFAIENPIGRFQNRAFIDSGTQMWNKNCYDYDMIHTILKKKSNAKLAFVLADVNGLKWVNDHYGHLEGDRLIKICADAMMDVMKGAYRIYRIGGDEFVAIYLDIPMEQVTAEIEETRIRCKEKSKGQPFDASMSFGYVERQPQESMEEVITKADHNMYEDKNEFYAQNGIQRRQF